MVGVEDEDHSGLEHVRLGAVVFVNALFMLASPRAWFRLPGWIRAQGTLTEGKYATGWGSHLGTVDGRSNACGYRVGSVRLVR